MGNAAPFDIIKNLHALKSLAIEAGSGEEAAMAFYKSGARGILFNLESIMRILRYSINKKKYDGYYDQFKKAEDILGAYDFHEASYKEISIETVSVPPEFVNYYKENMDDA